MTDQTRTLGQYEAGRHLRPRRHEIKVHIHTRGLAGADMFLYLVRLSLTANLEAT